MKSMRPHVPARRWAAFAFGVGLVLFPTAAHASNWDGFGEAVAAVLVSMVVLGAGSGVGILIPVAIMGRRSAPLAPWKRTVGVLGIVFASLSTAWNVMVAFVMLMIGNALSSFASEGETGLVVGIFLLMGVVPLAISVLAIILSARLYGRNKVTWGGR